MRKLARRSVRLALRLLSGMLLRTGRRLGDFADNIDPPPSLYDLYFGPSE